jgi:hypothetical protein
MKRAGSCAIVLLCAVAAIAGPPLAAPITEGARSGASYYNARTGNSWSYAAGDKDKSKAKVTVDGVENWAAHFHVDWGKKSTSGTWRVRDGAWMQKLPAHEESVVLPASVAVGARWTGPASIERGGDGNSQYEVISLDASVELPNSGTKDGCVAVLETGGDHGPVTHFYAPNTGKVAVQGPDGWMLRLVEFRSGHGGGD